MGDEIEYRTKPCKDSIRRGGEEQRRGAGRARSSIKEKETPERVPELNWGFNQIVIEWRAGAGEMMTGVRQWMWIVELQVSRFN